MIPREHLPLTLVTVALLGFIFLLFREINAVKTAVAQLSIPSVRIEEDGDFKEDDDFIDEEDDENTNDDLRGPKVAKDTRTEKAVSAPPKPILKSSSEKSSATTKGPSR